MPTALQASRDFMARGIARVRAGIEGVGKGSAQAGPEIKVDPFGAGNVSTPAALVKVATQVLASRRRRANYEMAREGAALARDKTRAEIAKLRAEEKYALGEGRQPAGQAPNRKVRMATDLGPFRAGQEYDENTVRVWQAGEREGRIATSRDRTKVARSKVSAANAALRQLDAGEKQEAEAQTNASMEWYKPQFEALTTGVEDVRKNAITRLGKDSGVDLSKYDAETTTEAQRIALQKLVQERLHANLYERKKRNAALLYAPRKKQHQAVIKAESLNLAAPSEAAAAPEDDPLGIFQP